MFSPHFVPIRAQIPRMALLLTGVLIVSAAFGIFLSASETIVVHTDESLAKYWRTAYDILVRPSGYRSEVEKEYNLVQPNYLLGIPGGITFAQYDTIRNIPGIEIAAPVAVIGAFPENITILITDSLPLGVFGVRCIINEDNGMRVSQRTFGPYFLYVGPDVSMMSEKERALIWPVNMADCSVEISGLMIGVIPEAEDILVGLSQVVEGSYLHTGPILPFLTDELGPGRVFPGLSKTGAYSIPVLVNATPYLSFTISGEVVQLELPPAVKGIRDIFEKGGPDFLATLPPQRLVAQKIIEREEAYQSVVQQITNRVLTLLFDPLTGETARLVQPSSLQYRPLTVSPIHDVDFALEAISFGERFRERTRQVRLSQKFGYFVVGTFNVENLRLPEELAVVPLETYFPPKAVLRFDENGVPAEPGVLRPTTDPYGYFISPPLFLTTLEAARAIAGDDCISAIRVRVAGVDRFSPEAQSKIEAVAAEIINRTGLDVDIVVGSSPRPVLVHLPGIGYVEEYWVQKGVALTTHREVQKANLLLFAAMLAVCALFIFNTTSTTVAGRIGEFGLLKALGWRGSSLAGLVLREGLLIGAVGGLAGTVLALGVAGVLGLVFPLGRALLILPTALLLCLAGFAFPAVRAARVAPVVALRRGEQAVGRVPRWAGYVGRSLWLRRMRTVLTAGVMAAGAGMVALLVSLVVGMRGYLALTLLGRYILVRVSGVHWGMVGVVLGVGALATADVLLVGVMERRGRSGC